MSQLQNLPPEGDNVTTEQESSGDNEIMAGTLDGFSVITRTKAVLAIIDPIVITPTNYNYMPETDMLNGSGAICLQVDSPDASNADSRLSKVLKNDRLD